MISCSPYSGPLSDMPNVLIKRGFFFSVGMILIGEKLGTIFHGDGCVICSIQYYVAIKKNR
jgi:hypothetical protein